MAQWYDKYLSVYGKPFSEVPQDVVDGTRERLANLQSDKPLASIVVIAYNEESHLQACLWAISEIVCKYPVEIIGVNNDSKDRTAEIFERSGIPYYTEYQHSCGYARRCGLLHSKGKYYFDVDSDTLYPPMYYELMIEQLLKPGIVAVSATWTYFPDEKHGKLGLKLFELCRDLFLYVQHFKRPELSVRGLVFAYNAVRIFCGVKIVIEPHSVFNKLFFVLTECILAEQSVKCVINSAWNILVIGFILERKIGFIGEFYAFRPFVSVNID